MRETSDPNELQPLTELANAAIQDYTARVKEFATSSRWGASAIALHMTEGPEGYNVLVGFELRTPLDYPLQDTITSHGVTKEQAAQKTVEEWLKLYIRAAMRVHRDSDPRVRAGETLPAATSQKQAYTWLMAEGSPQISSDNLDDMELVKKELAERSLFDRVNLGEIIPFHHEVPIVCVKLGVGRTGGANNHCLYECKLNNDDWPAGEERLKRFELPQGSRPMAVRQYLFFRHSVKKAAPKKVEAPAGKSVAGKAAAAKSVAGARVGVGGGTATHKGAPAALAPRKAWWKFW